MRVGEALRAATTKRSVEIGLGLLPDHFHRDDSSDGGHGHGFWLAGDEDDDGLIDHAWCFAARGIPRQAITAMSSIEWLRVEGRRSMVTPEWMGPLIAGGAFGPARIWRSTTPYVTPLHRLSKTGKERDGFIPPVQLAREIEARNLPTPTSIRLEGHAYIGEALLPASAFVVTRSKGAPPPSDAVAAFASVEFPTEVIGPLAFGYGAHFGLGQLLPSLD
ncbi:MAG: type I-U CRISPR-associated protein Csb2 [Vicinamibacterales bacterium]